MAAKDGKQDKAVTLNPVIRSVAGATFLLCMLMPCGANDPNVERAHSLLHAAIRTDSGLLCNPKFLRAQTVRLFTHDRPRSQQAFHRMQSRHSMAKRFALRWCPVTAAKLSHLKTSFYTSDSVCR